MTIYLIRHGQDDETVRGGWAKTPLTKEGINQIHSLSNVFRNLSLSCMYSSDLVRAAETTDILHKLNPNIPVIYNKGLREMNNGLLAGMSNEQAEIDFPGLYFRQLEWTECYPKGESPELFYRRVIDVWEKITRESKGDIAIVTHGGVINIILHHVNGLSYSNKNKAFIITAGSMTPIESKSKE